MKQTQSMQLTGDGARVTDLRLEDGKLVLTIEVLDITAQLSGAASAAPVFPAPSSPTGIAAQGVPDIPDIPVPASAPAPGSPFAAPPAAAPSPAREAPPAAAAPAAPAAPAEPPPAPPPVFTEPPAAPAPASPAPASFVSAAPDFAAQDAEPDVITLTDESLSFGREGIPEQPFRPVFATNAEVEEQPNLWGDLSVMSVPEPESLSQPPQSPLPAQPPQPQSAPQPQQPPQLPPFEPRPAQPLAREEPGALFSQDLAMSEESSVLGGARHGEPQPAISFGQEPGCGFGQEPPLPQPFREEEPAPPSAPEPGTGVLIRYTCPKCRTQGMQAVDKVGTVVTCSNCGKAMRLVMKK